MNWKLLLISLSLVVGILARPAEENPPIISNETTTVKIAETTNLTEKSATEALIADTTTSPLKSKITDAPTTTRYDSKRHDIIISANQGVDENRELKASSNLQLTSGNGVGSEITLKESYHQGVAVPMTLEEYEKELAREKDLISKAKKKISMESSTPKEGISTWILLSGSNDLTTTSRPEPVKPTYRVDVAEKKPVKANSTATTKKRIPVTSSPKVTTKPTKKFDTNKLLTRDKIAPANESVEKKDEPSTVAPKTTTKKSYQTTRKKVTTTRPKPTTSRTTPTTTVATEKTTSSAPEKTTEETVVVVDDERYEVQQSTSSQEPSTFLVMEAKESDFNLPDDRAPPASKVSPTKKSAVKSTVTKTKKKKTAVSTVTTDAPEIPTNATTKVKVKKIKNKSSNTKLASKKPEKPISTQIYNFLAREVMPSVGVGIVGLVVTAGLATYFLGGPLTALRRSYDIAANRRDDVAFDRSDDFGNAQDEGEMFGKVIAGMPENSAYRNNIRINSYRQRTGQPQPQVAGQAQPQSQYNAYPQYAQQKYQAQLAQHQQQQQYLRYRAADPYYNSYPQQNFVQQQQQQPQQPQPYYQKTQAKSSDYGTAQSIQAVSENSQKFNIDSVDMTTSEPSSSPYQMDYDEIAQSYFPQRDSEDSQQVQVEQQNIQEIETQKPQPQYQPQSELRSNEKLTIVNAQSVPSNHKTDTDNSLPQPEALKMLSSDEEYQNSIANAILSQQNNRKQFVVGSVIADNFEDTPGSIVPEHGPRRRRRDTHKTSKSLEDNEIERDESMQAPVEEVTHEVATEKNEIETASESTTQTYDINNGENNVFQLVRRVVDLKLRLGLNFLQNATLAFQQYLRGVEERMAASPLFNPYVNNTSSSKMNRKKVDEAL